MTQSFDEWVDKNSLNFHPTDYYLYKGIYEAGAQSKQAEIDELRKRIDERDKLINDFISDLDKTENENNSTSIHDYWRGFGSCAGSAKKILVERFNDLKGTTNEQ